MSIFFKKSSENEATKKSFEKMGQLLNDAHGYINAGHKDVAKSLLHELVMEAERNTDKISDELYPRELIKPTWGDLDGKKVSPLEEKFDPNRPPRFVNIFGRVPNPAKGPISIANAKDLDHTFSDQEEVIFHCSNCECIYSSHKNCPGCNKLTGPEDFPVDEEEEEIMEVAFEEPAPSKSNIERIHGGECISDRGTDHCGHCVDHCEASDNRKTNALNPDPRKYIVKSDGKVWDIFDTHEGIPVLQQFVDLDEAKKTCADLNRNYIDSITPAING